MRVEAGYIKHLAVLLPPPFRAAFEKLGADLPCGQGLQVGEKWDWWEFVHGSKLLGGAPGWIRAHIEVSGSGVNSGFGFHGVVVGDCFGDGVDYGGGQKAGCNRLDGRKKLGTDFRPVGEVR